MSVARTIEKDLELLKDVFYDNYNIINRVIGYNDITIDKLQKQNRIFKKLQTKSKTVLSKFRKTRKRPGKKTPSQESKSRSPTRKSRSPAKKSRSPTKTSKGQTRKSRSPTRKSGSPTRKSGSPSGSYVSGETKGEIGKTSPNQNPATKNNETSYTVGRFNVQDATPSPTPSPSSSSSSPSSASPSSVQIGRFNVRDADTPSPTPSPEFVPPSP